MFTNSSLIKVGNKVFPIDCTGANYASICHDCFFYVTPGVYSATCSRNLFKENWEDIQKVARYGNIFDIREPWSSLPKETKEAIKGAHKNGYIVEIRTSLKDTWREDVDFNPDKYPGSTYRVCKERHRLTGREHFYDITKINVRFGNLSEATKNVLYNFLASGIEFKVFDQESLLWEDFKGSCFNQDAIYRVTPCEPAKSKDVSNLEGIFQEFKDIQDKFMKAMYECFLIATKDNK